MDADLALWALLADSRVELAAVTGCIATDLPVATIHPSKTPRFLADMVAKHRRDLTLICASDPTPIAAAFEDREVARGLRRLIVVGGAWAPGAVLPWVRAEPHFGANPTAARSLLRAPTERVLVPTSLAWRVPLLRDDSERHAVLGDSVNVGLARKIRHALFWRRRLPLAAVLASLFVLVPEVLMLRSRSVAVLERGFLADDPLAPPSLVAEDVRLDLYRSVYWGAFAALAGWKTSR